MYQVPIAFASLQLVPIKIKFVSVVHLKGRRDIAPMMLWCPDFIRADNVDEGRKFGQKNGLFDALHRGMKKQIWICCLSLVCMRQRTCMHASCPLFFKISNFSGDFEIFFFHPYSGSQAEKQATRESSLDIGGGVFRCVVASVYDGQSVRGSVCPWVCVSVTIQAKPPKTMFSACETHRFTRPDLLLYGCFNKC